MNLRKVVWVGSSKEDLMKFPEAVRREIGYALHLAQSGDKPNNAKPLKEIGSGVMEIVSNFNTNTYRAIYTIKLGQFIYILHCFQKKSTQGIKTPKHEIDLIKHRVARAIEHSQSI